MDNKDSVDNNNEKMDNSKGNKKVPCKVTARQRLLGVQVVKPIIYGNDAWYIGEKRNEDGHTHKWNVYIKSYDNEDMSIYVKCVQFELHETYKDRKRVCYAPPYQLTETGYGEFTIIITIIFQDSNEKSVVIRHHLRLFNYENMSDPVNSENYDELVFMGPTATMHSLLCKSKLSISGAPQHAIDYEEERARQLKKVLEGKQIIKAKIADVKARFAAAQENIAKIKLEMCGGNEGAKPRMSQQKK